MPSTNQFVNSQSAARFVAWDGLEQLLNRLAIGQGAYSDEHAMDFKQKFAIGRTLAVPFSQRYIPQRNDMTFTPQALDRPYTTISADQTSTIPIQWESIEATWDMERGKERTREIYIKPMINYTLQAIETDLAQFGYRYSSMVTGALGTNPATYDATSATALTRLQQMGGHNYGDLSLFVPPAVNQSVKTGALTYFNPTVDLSKQFREGYIKTSDSFDWYSSMSLATHTAGVWANVASLTCNGANQSGASLNINCTAGDTFKFGDKFSIANVNEVNLMTRQTTSTSTAGTKTFTITADVTAAGATATLPIWPPIYGPGSHYQNVDALNAATALLTMWPGTTSPSGKSGKVALATAKGAFFVVGGKLPEPKGSVEFCEVAEDPNTGIQLRIIQQYVGTIDQFITRGDCAWGRGVGLAEQCSVAIACA